MPAAVDWKPIGTCPRERAVRRFRWADGREATGLYAPYWCGSDCPCYPLDEGPSEFLDSFPDCWGVEGHDTDPTHWAEAEAARA